MKCILIISMIYSCFSQTYSQVEDLNVFKKLIGKTWKAEGNWADGSKFRQEQQFEFGLGDKIVITRTSGFIDREQTKYGNRNYGVRMYDINSLKIKFWEYDIFGNLTEGNVAISNNAIMYIYKYGDLQLTDKWEYLNDSTFNYTVGELENDSWKTVYLNTQFRAFSNKIAQQIPDLIQNLTGTWTSQAWNGILNEKWELGNDGHMCQTSEYLEDGIVLYSSQSKIEIVGKDVILFSVILDSNPKIFKATDYSHEHITFENSEYANPNKVTYKFGEDSKFERTISGIENSSPSSYTFRFKKIKE